VANEHVNLFRPGESGANWHIGEFNTDANGIFIFSKLALKPIRLQLPSIGIDRVRRVTRRFHCKISSREVL
jgi:hypothetical protein